MPTLDVAIAVVDDRIMRGERPNSPGYKAQQILTDAGLRVTSIDVLPEETSAVRDTLTRVAETTDILLTVGATGLRRTDIVPEVTRELLHRELPHVATQILLAGLKNTNKAGLSRGLVGVRMLSSNVSAPDGNSGADHSCLIVNSPSSSGGIKDTLGVVLPLLPSIFEQLREQ